MSEPQIRAVPLSILWARCLKCNGSGMVPTAPGRLAELCDVCDGEGRVYLAWPPRRAAMTYPIPHKTLAS